MKKVMVVVFGVWLLAASAPVRAEVSAQSEIGGDVGLKTYVCGTRGNASTGCNNAIAGPVFIKGFKLNAEAAGQCALFDATTVPRGSGADPISGLVDEILEATAGDGAVHMWPHPIQFLTAVSIAVTGSNNSCVVYY